MKTRYLLSCTLAVALAVGMVTAQASGYRAQQSLTGLTFGVLDLTPTDGVTAQYSYTTTGSEYNLRLLGPQGRESILTDTVPGLAAAEYSFARGGSRASLVASGDPGELSLDATVMQALGIDGQSFASVKQTYEITLSAYSVLTVSGHAYLDAAPLSAGASPYTSSYTGFQLELSSGYGPFGRYLKSVVASSPTSVFDDDFWIGYANTTDHDITVRMTLDAYASGYISAVPEPATYAMLGAGLLLVGVTRRRASRI